MNTQGLIWPSLEWEAWKQTTRTLHLWMQIAGKVRLVQTPWINHSWHVPFYLSVRGLTSSLIPCRQHLFQIDFDFIDHLLRIQISDGTKRTMALRSRPVADFYHEFTAILAELDLDIRIHTMPNEIPDAVPFEQDRVHASYDPEYANRFWRILSQTYRVFEMFRARFIGKCSPIHFFWGSFDLAVTRFSGRPAPPHPGGVPNLPDWVVREAYSQEVSSAGFWPGNDQTPYPMFYSYTYPEPPGYNAAAVRPDKAAYDTTLREFVLPYDQVRLAARPDDVLLEFLQTTYEAAAVAGQWNRAALEWAGPPVK